MKQPIRYFSIGLIFAGLTLFVVHNFFDEPAASTEHLEIDELLETVKDHGYYVMEESEYIRLSVIQDSLNEDEEADPAADEAEEEETESEETEEENEPEESDEEQEEETESEETEEEQDEEAEETTATTYTITIEPDMLPTDVTRVLEEQQIISDASEFNQFLEREDLSRLIQIGSFDVSSDMSQLELAQVITRTQ